MKLLDQLRQLFGCSASDKTKLEAITARLTERGYTLALLDPQGVEIKGGGYYRRLINVNSPSVITWTDLPPCVIGGWRIHGSGIFNGAQGVFPTNRHIFSSEIVHVSFEKFYS